LNLQARHQRRNLQGAQVMNTTPDTRHLDTDIAILGGGQHKPSLKARNTAAKARSPALSISRRPPW
jgi:hypothetical protein